jgi:hypothetical protein
MSDRERTVTEEQVRAEHLREVNVRAHWLYIGGVLGGGFALMLALLWVLGGAE